MPLTLESVVYISHFLISSNTSFLITPWSVDQSSSPVLEEWRVRYRLSDKIERADEQYTSYHDHITTTGISNAPRGTVVHNLKYTWDTVGVRETVRTSLIQHYLEFVLSHVSAATARVQHDHGLPEEPIGLTAQSFRLQLLSQYLDKTYFNPLLCAGQHRKYLIESLSVSANHRPYQSIFALDVTSVDGSDCDNILPGRLNDLDISIDLVIQDIVRYVRRYRRGPTYLGCYWHITYANPRE